MSENLQLSPDGAVFRFRGTGIYRWDSCMAPKHGTYGVIYSRRDVELVAMALRKPPYVGFKHPTCVVDDFGSLIAVEAA